MSMSDNKEIRSLPASGLEIRKANGKRTLVGVAAPFNSLSVNLGGFRERIQPGAFSASLRSNPDVILSADHTPTASKILARTSAGTLQLREDPNQGLMLTADLPQTTFADDIVESISRGDLQGLSISFVADDDDWQDTSDGVIRTLRSVNLGSEISLVCNPAYTATSVSLRSAPESIRHLLTPDDDTILAVILAKRKQF
jgi:HK97 family phage prohead protease